MARPGCAWICWKKRQWEELETDFSAQVAAIAEKLDVDQLDIEELPLGPRKSDIAVSDFGVAWLPWHVDATGIAEPAY